MDTVQDIIDFFQTLVSDAPDSVSTLVLLNQADAVIRRLRPWEILKVLDQSKTHLDGEGFSNTKALPTDFDRPNKIYIGTAQRAPLKRVRLEEQQFFLNSPGLYSLDYKNGTLAISAGTWAGTIYNHYIYKPLRLAVTADATHLNAPVFPNDFWPLYAYAMAEIQMGGIDEDDRSLAAVPQWLKQQSKLWDAMVSWDADLKDEGDVLRIGADDMPPPVDLGLL